MISFKGVHFPKEVILYAVFFYVRYGVSYRDLEEILDERGVQVDHATLNRWVINYSPLISAEAKKSKRTVATSWRMDETYIKVKGKWVYLYCAVDKFGDTLDFMLSEQRDVMAATAFFKQAINNNGFPHKVVMDKSGANYTPRGQVFGFLKQLEVHSHQTLHLAFKTCAKITDAVVDAVSKRIETLVMLTIQNLFFNKTP